MFNNENISFNPYDADKENRIKFFTQKKKPVR